jgi:competence protein ComGC
MTYLQSNQAKRPAHRRRFSLTEMLVVVVIIIILASMLLPTIEEAMERSRRAVCAANLNQVGKAANTYGFSFDRYLPGGNATIGRGWGIDSSYAVSANRPMGLAVIVHTGFLDKDSVQILYCPSWRHRHNQYDVVDYGGLDPVFGPGQFGGWPANGVGSPGSPTAHIGFSYHYRSSFYATPTASQANRPPNYRMDDPSGTAIVADHWTERYSFEDFGSDFGHFDGYSTMYLDGHVQWLEIGPRVAAATHTFSHGQWEWQESSGWTVFFDD